MSVPACDRSSPFIHQTVLAARHDEGQ